MDCTGMSALLAVSLSYFCPIRRGFGCAFFLHAKAWCCSSLLSTGHLDALFFSQIRAFSFLVSHFCAGACASAPLLRKVSERRQMVQCRVVVSSFLTVHCRRKARIKIPFCFRTSIIARKSSKKPLACLLAR
jgi:hypothetical protein